MPAPGSSRWAIAIPSFFLGVIVALALAGGVAYGVYRAVRSEAPRAEAKAPVLDRDEFSRRVMDRSEDEVIAAVGRPDDTSEDNGTKFWHYKKRTRDPLTRREDTDVQVVIKRGKVVNINY